VQGSRPVTLVGFSMGARVIFHCLEALHGKGDAGLGIVENAVLLGAPVCKSAERWRACRAVVAGRLVNGYSSKDWALAFLFRRNAWELGLAGLSPVEGCGVENVDLSDAVPGHLAYPRSLPNIVARLQLES
jgi:pimeloyl-ACP methyl ester carboxylesterase